MPLLPSALPPKGEARRYVANDFLNLIELPPGGRQRNEDAAFPILSFRAKARNLFRSRSGKGCEDSGKREAPCFPRIGRTVFHADGFMKENGRGKRKRSLGCARDDETEKDLFPFLFIPLRKPTSAPKGRIRIKCSAVLCKSIYESSIIKQMI